MKAVKVICLLLLTLTLSACENQNQHTCPSGISTSTFPLIASVKKYPGPGQGQLPPYEEVKTTEQDAKPSITKNIAGEKVTGTYLYSTKKQLDAIRARVYQTQDGRLFGSDLDGILRFYTWNIDESIQDVCTQEECQQIAKAFLTPYLNVDNYKVSVVAKEDHSLYEFTFTKYYGEYKTVDQAIVTVHQSGQLYAYSSNQFGQLPDQAIGSVDEAKILDLVDQEIATSYPNIAVSRSEPVCIYQNPAEIYCLVDIEHQTGDVITNEQLVFYIYLC